MPQPTTNEITRDDELRLEGLLTLARDHNAALKDIERSIAGIVGEGERPGGDYGFASDAVVEGWRAGDLLRRMDLRVEDSDA